MRGLPWPRIINEKRLVADLLGEIAIYKRLLDLGIRAELEAGAGDWHAYILVGNSKFGSRLASQLSQSKLRMRSPGNCYSRMTVKRTPC
jgi:hypothetical protein